MHTADRNSLTAATAYSVISEYVICLLIIICGCHDCIDNNRNRNTVVMMIIII